MRRLPLALVLGSLAFPAAGGAQQVTLTPQNAETASRVISHAMSSGRGEVRVTPDHAIITAVIDTRADTAGGAAAENARRYDALIHALQGAGVAASQISSPGYTVTTGFPGAMAVSPEIYRSMVTGEAPRAPARPSSTLARRSIRVDMVRMGDVDRVVAAALAAGATQLGVQLEAPSLEGAQRAALTAAVADARANGDAMARGAGGTLGRLVDLNNSFSPFGGIISYASSTPYEGSPFTAGGSPPVVRDLTVVATVTARWEIVLPAASQSLPAPPAR